MSGQIVLKTVSFAENVTVLGGLPIPIVTSSQGAAFDIVSQNKADPSALQCACDRVTKLASVAACGPMVASVPRSVPEASRSGFPL